MLTVFTSIVAYEVLSVLPTNSNKTYLALSTFAAIVKNPFTCDVAAFISVKNCFKSIP